MTPPARHSPTFFLINTAAFLAVSGIAAAALWPIYASREIVLLIVGTLSAGALIAVLGALFRWSSATVLLATVVAFLALGTPLALPDQTVLRVLPSPASLLDLLRGAGLGWKQLLTITLPVGSYQQLLVPAFVLVLLSTVVGLSVTLRARFGELGVLAPTALFLAAAAFGPDAATDFPVELALAFLVVTLLWFVWVRWYRRTRAIRLLNVQNGAPVESVAEQNFVGARTLLGAVATIAVALVVSAAATVVAAPTGAREVLRTAVEQPFDPRDYASPLAGFRQYLQQGRDTQSQLVVTGLPEDAAVRIATLDTYDGVVYSVGGATGSGASGTFARVPYRLDPSADGAQVTIDVVVDAYTGVWLPTVGRLESIEFGGPNAAALEDSFFYNDVTGTAAVTTGLRSGDTYRLTAVVPEQPDERALAFARPGSAVVPGFGTLPDDLLPSLQTYIAGADRPGERLVAVLDGLRSDGYVSHGVSPDEPFSRSGHGADRITELLTDRPMVGDAEQYAVTAALMASELGFPARVVFGIRAGADDGDGAPDEGLRLTGGDVTAWVEVNTQDGWVSVDPNPEVREIPEAEPDEPTVVSRPQSVLPPPEDERIELDEQLPPETSEEEQAETDPLLALLFTVLRVAGGVLLVLALLTSPFLAILAAKVRRRRRRRRNGTPLDRIQGGWQEFADTAVDHGYELPPSSTRTEVAETVGGSASLVLARAADRAAFGPALPDERAAEQVWRVVADLRASIARERTRWGRILALVSIRSLTRHGSRLLPRLGAPAAVRSADPAAEPVAPRTPVPTPAREGDG